jgi:hypothetical protein
MLSGKTEILKTLTRLPAVLVSSLNANGSLLPAHYTPSTFS